MTSKSALSTTRHDKTVFCLRAMAWMMRIDARNLASGKIITSCVVVFFSPANTLHNQRGFFRHQYGNHVQHKTYHLDLYWILVPARGVSVLEFDGITLGEASCGRWLPWTWAPGKTSGAWGHFLEWKSMIFRFHVKLFGGTKALPVSGSCSSLKLSVDIPNFLAAVCWWKISQSGWSWIHSYGVHQRPWSSSMIFHDCQWLSWC